MGGSKGHQRGPKTHKADMKISRGEHEEPQQDMAADSRETEPREEGRRKEALHEHPTGRMNHRGVRDGARGRFSGGPGPR